MKFSKFLSGVIVASALVATVADAGSIGRSGGSSSGGRSSSSSVSHSSSSSVSKSSSYSAPSKPAVAPAPAQAGGIGGTTASVGVRKSEVTNGVKQDIAHSNPAPGKPGSFSAGATPSTSPSYAPAPHYSAPAPVVVQSGGGGFGSSFMGAMGGTIVGNALFGNHGHGGGTTVINNGTPSGSSSSGVVATGPQTVTNSDGTVVSNGTVYPAKKEYTVWSFIADLFGFVIVVAILLGIAWLFYKGFQMVRNYVNKERGVSTQPFNPTQRFWEIQKAFAAAELTTLQNLLGPDVVDELTNGLQPSGLTIKNVSHEVRLENNTEFSIWYKFFETDGEEVNQVWHYEKFGKDWKLNGIENV
jgi:hypothetical protein